MRAVIGMVALSLVVAVPLAISARMVGPGQALQLCCRQHGHRVARPSSWIRKLVRNAPTIPPTMHAGSIGEARSTGALADMRKQALL